MKKAKAKSTKSSAKISKIKAYNPASIETKWQKKWQKSKLYQSKEGGKKEKFYVLDMFPYPSGEGLHVGHPKGYIATDVISRYKRMNGNSVLHPMGFDAFGLPAENYALKTKTNPADSVKKNVARYKKQLEILGFDYDWSREVNTTDPKYYKWTQWIFLKLLEKGLAYESFEPINWCPSCKTGLANEDVEDGRCERCGTVVEKKPMRQWVLKITDYAERLLSDLDLKNEKGNNLLDWPEAIKTSQKNWIGKSEGAVIKFKVRSEKCKIDEGIEVFTTRPDTLFGVTYVVLAPEHKLVADFLEIVENKSEVEEYIKNVKKISEIDRTDAKKEKTGVELRGIKVINPANNEEVPLWIADYVLPDYGTGAVMAVPAHDDRDWDFATKYNLPIKQVIAPHIIDKRNPPVAGKQKVERKNVHVIVRNPKDGKILCLKWKKHPWTTFPMGGIEEGEDLITAAKREVYEETGYKNLINGKVWGGIVRAEYFAAHKDQNRLALTSLVTFDLENEEKDNINENESAQHEIFWESLSTLTDDFMTHSEMPIWHQRLNGQIAYTGDGIVMDSAQFNGRNSEEVKKEITEFVGGQWVTKYKLRDWVFSRQRYWGEPIPVIHCENCKLIRPESNGIVPVPVKDLPVELPRVKSYEPTGTGESPLASIDKWVNVKCPVCKGKAKRETNTMPQWAGSSWYYLRYMDPKNSKALVDAKKEKYWSPVDVYVGGAEHATRHLIYARFWHKFLFDIGVVSSTEPFIKLQHVGLIMGEDGRKMSKRFGNVVNPDDIVKNYGADSLRLYEMFMGPFDQEIAWSTASISGVRRFIEKVWKLRDKFKIQNSKFKVNIDEDQKEAYKIEKVIHKTIKKVTEDIQTMRFNTAISGLMIAVNEIEKFEFISKVQYQTLLQLVAPFAPHFTEEIWTSLGNKKSIHISVWPKYEPSLIVDDEVTIMIQVNGKVRGSFVAPANTDQQTLEKLAKENDDVKKWLEGKLVVKVIVVPKRLVNFVVS